MSSWSDPRTGTPAVTGRALALLGWLGLLLAGTACVSVAMSPETLANLDRVVQPYPVRISIGLVGVGMACLCIAVALMLVRGAGRGHAWVVLRPEGDTIVELAPIEVALERVAREQEDVIDARVRLAVVRTRGKPGVRGRVVMVLREQANVAGRATEVAELLRSRFKDILPEAGDLHLLRVLRVRPEERGMSVVSEPEDAEGAGRAGTEFWGPVYPVSPGDEETQGNV